MDRFEYLMIELEAMIESKEHRFRKVFPDKKMGEFRYKENYIGMSPDCDAILIFQEDENNLNFAKKVAKAYGCTYKVVQHEKAPEGGKFECKIYF